jgi:deazaflavin-dependent oxidoreductase (nitroreductase family)
VSGKRRWANWFHRHLANPVMRRVAGRLPGQALLETVGRRSGLPRRTPVGGRMAGTSFWFVSNHGPNAGYVKNILSNPEVRIQLRGRWYRGTAHVLPDDDPRLRLKTLPRFNSAMVRLLGTVLTTIRIDLDVTENHRVK